MSDCKHLWLCVTEKRTGDYDDWQCQHCDEQRHAKLEWLMLGCEPGETVKGHPRTEIPTDDARAFVNHIATYYLGAAAKDDIREMIPQLFPLIYNPDHPLRRALERSKMLVHDELPPQTAALKTPSQHLLNLFDQHELDPLMLVRIASRFKGLAEWVSDTLPPGPEQTVCLRHLLDAKHAAVRALITDDTPVKT